MILDLFYWNWLHMKPHHVVYCRIVLTHGGKCFWTTKILLVCGDIILCAACLVHYAIKNYELWGWKSMNVNLQRTVMIPQYMYLIMLIKSTLFLLQKSKRRTRSRPAKRRRIVVASDSGESGQRLCYQWLQ